MPTTASPQALGEAKVRHEFAPQINTSCGSPSTTSGPDSRTILLSHFSGRVFHLGLSPHRRRVALYSLCVTGAPALLRSSVGLLL